MHNKINNQYVNNVQYCCRVPQGTCGLKSPETGANVFRKDVGSRKGPVD